MASARPLPLARGGGLAHDPLQHERQLRPHLRLLVRGEDVDDAVDGLGRGVRVQRGEGEVARLGDAQRGLDRLQVAHLAISTTSGSSRSAARSAFENEWVSECTSRWFTTHFLC